MFEGKRGKQREKEEGLLIPGTALSPSSSCFDLAVPWRRIIGGVCDESALQIKLAMKINWLCVKGVGGASGNKLYRACAGPTKKNGGGPFMASTPFSTFMVCGRRRPKPAAWLLVK